MKRVFACFLALAMMLGIGSAMADTSVFGTDTSFSMNFDNLSSTESHVLALKAGDELYVSSVVRRGTVSITIKEDVGDVLFSTDKETASGQTVSIPRDGIYRITVIGNNAAGNVWINQSSGADTGADRIMPSNEERIRSNLGYTMAYEPEYFLYAAGEMGDTFTGRGENNTELSDYMVVVSREQGSYNDVADEILKNEGAIEMRASVIDWRPARTIRYQSGAIFDSKIQEFTVIETGDNEVMIISCTYLAGSVSAAQKMQSMIQSIKFLY